MNDFKIEKMNESDLSEVAKIFCTVFSEEGENWDEENSLKRVTDNFQSDAHYVARVDGKIVGMIMAMPVTLELTTALLVDSFVVLKEYRGKGIGKELWKNVEEHAKRNEYKSVRLFAHPKWNSYNLYMKIGYQPSGWVELFKEIE